MIEAKPLPYSPDSLAPNISKDTVNVHYERHYKGYVNNLNKLIKGTIYEDLSLEEIVKQSDGPIFNNAAQVYNHEFYFNSMSKGGGEPSDKLKEAIEDDWESFADFTQDFISVSKKMFGSGWAWLVWDTYEEGLRIYGLPNADNPLAAKLYIFRETENYIPIMTCDLWEHAYYLDYANDRDSYLKNFWEIVNWEFASKNFEAIKHD